MFLFRSYIVAEEFILDGLRGKKEKNKILKT